MDKRVVWKLLSEMCQKCPLSSVYYLGCRGKGAFPLCARGKRVVQVMKQHPSEDELSKLVCDLEGWVKYYARTR